MKEDEESDHDEEESDDDVNYPLRRASFCYEHDSEFAERVAAVAGRALPAANSPKAKKKTSKRV